MRGKFICLITVVCTLACNLPLTSRSPTGEYREKGGKSIEDTPPSSSEQEKLASVSNGISHSGPPVYNLPDVFPAAPSEVNIALQVDNDSAVQRENSPVTSGVPFPEELRILDASSLKLVDENGKALAAQFTPLARWGASLTEESHPLRWALLDFQTTLEPGEVRTYFIQEGGPGPQPQQAIHLSESDEELTIDTGSAHFTLSKRDGRLNAPFLTEPIDSIALDADMQAYHAGRPQQIKVELDSPMRTSISVKGSYVDDDGNTLLDYTARYWFYAGLPLVRLFYTVENNTPCPLIEYEQINCFDIGSAGSVDLHELSLNLQLESSDALQFSITGDNQPVRGELTNITRLYQDSSGTAFWNTYPEMTDWDDNPLDTRPRMQAYVNLPGYQTTLGSDIIDNGSQAQGLLTVSDNRVYWSVAVRDFWQNFPKALQASPQGSIEIQLFPGEFGGKDYDFNLRAGEHKTHEIWLSASGAIPLAPVPLFAQATPAWYVDSGAFGLTALRDEMTWPEHEQYLSDQLNTSLNHSDNWDVYENLFDAIERTDFYGIFDYGDLPIDYEGFGVSPLNPKYDFDYGMWLQWARGSDVHWFDLAEATDRHVADIDLLHTLHNPRHWSDGNMFGHSYHDEDGFANPHRNYGGLTPDTAFGMQGMLLLYYLTGYEKAHESAMELADYVEFRLHNDDYLCNYYHDGPCNGSGYALFDGLYNAGARPAANSLSIAVAAYRATADPRYWTVATALVLWAAPQNQPYIDGPNGGHDEEDHMRPWMLNMYLRALSQYIQTMEEYDLPDEAKAKEAYLTYADWLHRYAWIELEPIESGSRAAYPYQWWFDGRQGDPDDEYSVGNNVPSINNWLYLGADAMAYAYHISGDEQFLTWAAELFRTGSHDEFYPGDESLYTETKQAINALTYGNVFLYEWARKE